MAEEVSNPKRASDSLSDEHTVAAPDLLAKTSSQTTSPPESLKTSGATTEEGDEAAEPLPLPPAPEVYAQVFSPTELEGFEIDILDPLPAKKVTDAEVARSLEQKNSSDKRDTAPIRSEEVIQTLTQALDDDKIPDGDRTGVDKLIKVLSLPANKARISEQRQHLTVLDYPVTPKAAPSRTAVPVLPLAPQNSSPPSSVHATLAIVPPPPPPPVKKVEPPAVPGPSQSTPPTAATDRPATIAPSRITQPEEPEDNEYGGFRPSLTVPVGLLVRPTPRRRMPSWQLPSLRLLGLLAVILAGIVCVARFTGQKEHVSSTTRSVAFLPPPPRRPVAPESIRPQTIPSLIQAPASKIAVQQAALPVPEPKERIVYLYTLKKSDRARHENTLEALAERFGCDAQSLANNNTAGSDLTAQLAPGTTLWLPKNCPYDSSKGLHSGVVLGRLVMADEAPLPLQAIAKEYGCRELGKLKRYLKANNPTADPLAIPSGTRVWLPSTLCRLESP